MLDSEILNFILRLSFEEVVVMSGVFLLVEADLPEKHKGGSDKDCQGVWLVIGGKGGSRRERRTDRGGAELELIGGVVIGCLVG